MICPKCGCSVNDHPFMRMNELGAKGIFWCEPCAEKYEPELYRNQKEDGGKFEEDLIEICYPKK